MDEILNEFDLEAEWDGLVAELDELGSSIPVTPSIEALIPADRPVVINIDDFPLPFVPPSRTTGYPNYLPHNQIAEVSLRSLHTVNQPSNAPILHSNPEVSNILSPNPVKLSSLSDNTL